MIKRTPAVDDRLPLGVAESRVRWRLARRWPRLRRLSILAVPDGVPSESRPLLRYLDELQAWSYRAWSAAGILRPWLPEAIRNHVRQQWWVAGPTPTPDALRRCIATFWTSVVPWTAWSHGAEDLPDPPSDPLLREMITDALRIQISRAGRGVVGSDRSAAFERAMRHLERAGPVQAAAAKQPPR